MQALSRVNLSSFPIMGKAYGRDQFFKIDLSRKSHHQNFVNQLDLRKYVEKKKLNMQKKFAYGGYGERRGFYQSGLFLKDEEHRDVHLGIDIWSDFGVEIFAPLDGRIVSIQYNDKSLDYGYTLIIKHKEKKVSFYSLFGHLSSSIYQLWKPGDVVTKSELLAHIGNMEENGGWIPHLHFQLIFDLQGNTGDYPGVCSQKNKIFYLNNCPNPLNLILPM